MTNPAAPVTDPPAAVACPPGEHQMPDGTCMPDAEMMPTDATAAGTPWHGPIAVEGVWSGDGRQWAPDSIEWADLPLTLKWQEEEMPRHDGAVVAGRVDGIIRVDGGMIYGWGVFDDKGDDGAEALRLVQAQMLRGLSLKADDVDPEDVELIWTIAEEGDEASDSDAPLTESSDEDFHLAGKHDQKAHGGKGAPPSKSSRRAWTQEPGYKPTTKPPRQTYRWGSDSPETFAEGDMMDPALLPEHPMPEPRKIYHHGRIRSVTLVAEAAFPDCVIQLGPPPPEILTAAAVGEHSTATSDATWNGPANEKRLPSPLPESKARAAYAWIDDGAVQDGQVTKEACRFLHHEINADGNVGPANLTACSTAIAILNGGRGGTKVDASGKRGIWDHVAAHLRDAGREPPPLTVSTGPTTVTAAGYSITIPDVWPDAWFERPERRPPFGAVHITDQGRLYGYLAPDKVAHRAFRASGRTVTAPRNIDYSEFQNKPALVAGVDGQVYRINAGNITMGCGHPSPHDPRRADPAWAQQHYDNTCSIVARVRVGEDEHGTWVAGALLHGIDTDTVERMMACALSGDWQAGRLNAALLVPVEGFPTPVQGHVRVRDGAVVASLTPLQFASATEMSAGPDLRPVLERLARSVGRDTASRFADLQRRREGVTRQ